MRHDLEAAEVKEAETLLPRLLERLRSLAEPPELFFLPIDARSGRILLWEGMPAVFSSRAHGEHAVAQREHLRNLPLNWLAARPLELNPWFRKLGVPEGALWTLNPCGACDWAERYSWELSLDPEALMQIWAADSASRFGKISVALLKGSPPLLEELKWLKMHVDAGVPELLEAIAALEKGKSS